MWCRFRPRTLRALAARGLVTVMLATLAAGCSVAGARTDGAPAISPVPRATPEELVLYFPHRSRPMLVREVRQVSRAGEQPEMFALTELLKGPRSPEARPVLLPDKVSEGAWSPAEVAIGAKVFDGAMTLILTRRAADALTGSGTLMDVYAVVNTAALSPRVWGVRFIQSGDEQPLEVEGVNISAGIAPRWDLVDPANAGLVVKARAELQDADFPAGCRPAELASLVGRFLDAFNRGDGDALARFFSPDLQWYSVTEAVRAAHFTSSDPEQVLAYLARRHAQHERLQLVYLSAGVSHGGSRAALDYVLLRQADDLPAAGDGPGHSLVGKAEIECDRQAIYVWSMAAQRP